MQEGFCAFIMLRLGSEVLPAVVTEVIFTFWEMTADFQIYQCFSALEAFAQCMDLLSTSVCSNSTSYSTQFTSGRMCGMKYRSQEMFIKRRSYHK